MIAVAEESDYAAALDCIDRGPDAFARVILRHRLWSKSVEILNAIEKHPQVAIKGCHSSSKTFTLAEATLYWLTKHYIRNEQCVVITTAPKFDQVEKGIWSEIRAAAQRSIIPYRPLQTKLVLGPKCYAFGMTTRSEASAQAGVRFSGIKAENMLVIIDEASGIAPDIWEAIHGLLAGGRGHVAAIGNPLVPSGAFFDCFNANREMWHCITIDAMETPNLEGLSIEDLLEADDATLDDNEFPFLATRRWVRDRYLEYVRRGGDPDESPAWQGRVRAEFPRQDAYQLIWGKWIQEAVDRDVPERSKRRIAAGIDVAGGGESETVCYILDGWRIVDFAAWSKTDPRQEVVDFLEPYRAELAIVNVDATSIGHYFYLALRDQRFPVNPVNVQEASPDERFENLKAWAYFQMRDAFEAGLVSNLTDATTQSQLATIRQVETLKGTTAIEPKPAMRKRGVASPDRAEALMLAGLANTAKRMTIPDMSKSPLRTRISSRP